MCLAILNSGSTMQEIRQLFSLDAFSTENFFDRFSTENSKEINKEPVFFLPMSEVERAQAVAAAGLLCVNGRTMREPIARLSHEALRRNWFKIAYNQGRGFPSHFS
jgi:hypothetical protein